MSVRNECVSCVMGFEVSNGRIIPTNMGFFDANVHETRDRHDHANVIEGDQILQTSRVSEPQIILLIVGTIIVVGMFFYVVKRLTDRCFERFARSIRRDDTPL